MKIIQLITLATVAGNVRRPEDGPQTVEDDEAARLKELGALDGEPEDVREPEDEKPKRKSN